MLRFRFGLPFFLEIIEGVNALPLKANPASSTASTIVSCDVREASNRIIGIPPPNAACPDLLIGVKSMAYVMRYNHFPH